MDKKKALIITPFYPPSKGGAETYSKALYDEAVKKYGEKEIDLVICNPAKFKKPFKGTGIKQFFMVFPELMIKSLIKIRRCRYETIHAQGLNATLVGSIIKRITGSKLLVTILALYNYKAHLNKYSTAFMPKVVTSILNSADKIFVEGFKGEEDLTSIGVKKEKITHFQHWVTFPEYDFDRRFHDKLRILFVGRPIHEKGINIIKRIQGRLIYPLMSFAFVEDVSHDLLRYFYEWADVLVVPSTYSEGFVRVVVEAAWHGCAIVTSNCGALPEMVKDYGVIVEPLEKNFMYELVRLNKDKVALYKMQRNSWEYAMKNYTAKNAGVMINEY